LIRATIRTASVGIAVTTFWAGAPGAADTGVTVAPATTIAAAVAKAARLRESTPGL
jgi:hypothetical protein